jgi:hypothetical protein
MEYLGRESFHTEVIHQVDDEKEIEVVAVAVQHRDLNDEIHFHYVHVRIVHENLIEKDLHDVTSRKKYEKMID